MKTIEITDNLYDKVMEESKGGMPFEPTMWKIIQDRNNFRQMNKEMMTMMLGAAMKIPPDEMMKKMKEIEDAKDDLT